MSEQLQEDPWTDEVCQAWLDMAADESKNLRLSSSEESIYLLPRMPQAVREYKMAQVAEIIVTGFTEMAMKIPGIIPETIQVKTDVDIINPNR